MAKVSLDSPNPGFVWRQVPESVKFHIDGAGKVATDYTFDMEGDSALSPVLLGAAIKQGLTRYVGTATTSAKEDESEKEACDRRFAEMVAGTYKPGSGGGARKSTYAKVLHESVVTVLTNNGWKKVDATKLASTDTGAAFLAACDKVAEGIADATGQEIFDIQWPKVESAAKSEADRRDAADSSSFDLGDFAA